MRATFDLPLAQGSEPTFDLVKPRTRCRCEMDMKARMPRQPSAHGRGLVGAVVIHHEMHLQVSRDTGFDGAQEFQKLLAPVPPMQLAHHLAAGDVEGGEQGGGTVAQVVMGTPLWNAGGYCVPVTPDGKPDGFKAVDRQVRIDAGT